MNLPNYNIVAGTVVGEIHNEVYSKYGELVHSNSHYGWHTENVSEINQKIYNLVNSPEGVKFLIAVVFYDMKDVTPKDPITKKPISVVPVMLPDPMSPIKLEFIWQDAGIPFITKQEADAQNLTYNL